MAARYWVGGTGTWDASDTTHWAASSGGAGGQSVPTSADSVVIDAASGTAPYTITVVGSMTIGGLTFLLGTATLDFASSNMTFTGVVNFSGTATRTVKYGSGTHTFNNNLSMNNTGLTLDVGTATLIQKGGGTMMTGL